RRLRPYWRNACGGPDHLASGQRHEHPERSALLPAYRDRARAAARGRHRPVPQAAGFQASHQTCDRNQRRIKVMTARKASARKFSVSEVTTIGTSFEEDVRLYAEAGCQGIGVWGFKMEQVGWQRASE